MQIFDIILMALIVIFLVLRLRGVLGSRDGFDGNPNNQRGEYDDKDNVIKMPGTRTPDVAEPELETEVVAVKEDKHYEGLLGEGVQAIREADPDFRVDEFLQGASYAFEMILNAYAAGDVKTLKPLLSSDVYGGFAGAIEDRETRGQTLQETLVGLKNCDLVEAYMDGRDAHVTVKFVSEQISALLDDEGAVIEGDPTKVISATDFWTFSRSTKSRNPNWTLVGTGALS
jgi:predicted lipid-binding transport protein (Tim44 family)